MTTWTQADEDDVKPLTNDLYRGAERASDEWVESASCPECGSSRVYRFKLNQMEQGYKCRDCGAWDFS
jgi:predicted RNA-binding Zn-ribbon protein involved in translation (DUF1610 family)